MIKRHAERLRHKQKGQGLVEFALTIPVLLIVLSGMVEVGFLFNDYMALQDATRNAARYAADGLYDKADADANCMTTRDYYRQIGCLVIQELAQERPLPMLNIGNGADDVIVSVFTVAATSVSQRHPASAGEAGWSMAETTPGWLSRNQSSKMSSAWVNGRLDSVAPNTGLVLVEVFYQYRHKLGLPWITAFIPNPTVLHVYTIMPNSSAEPTATPEP